MRAEVLEETIRLELEQQAERFGARIRNYHRMCGPGSEVS